METREIVGTAPDFSAERPDPEWVRSACPMCGSDVVSNVYHVGGKAGGYVIVWECWESLKANRGEQPTCDYRRVI